MKTVYIAIFVAIGTMSYAQQAKNDKKVAASKEETVQEVPKFETIATQKSTVAAPKTGLLSEQGLPKAPAVEQKKVQPAQVSKTSGKLASEQ